MSLGLGLGLGLGLLDHVCDQLDKNRGVDYINVDGEGGAAAAAAVLGGRVLS